MTSYHIIHRTFDKYVRFFLFHNTLLGQNIWEIHVTSQAGSFDGLTDLQAETEKELLDKIKDQLNYDTQLKFQSIQKDEDSLTFTTLIDFCLSSEDYKKALINLGWSKFLEYCPNFVYVKLRLAYASYEEFINQFDWELLSPPAHPADWNQNNWLWLGDLVGEKLMIHKN